MKKDRLTQIGLDRLIRIAWLEKTAFLALGQSSANEIRTILRQEMAGAFRSTRTGVRGSLDKTVTILMNAWITVPQDLEALRASGLEIFRQTSEQEHRLLHWGMLTAAYPFWSRVATQVGRLLNLQGSAAAAHVQRRVREQYGERETVSRRARYVMRSYVDWGVLNETGEKGVYSACPPLVVDDPQLIAWLMEAVLRSRASRSAPVRDLIEAPCLFPFSIATMPPEGLLSASASLEVYRHGLDDDLIILREQPSSLTVVPQSGVRKNLALPVTTKANKGERMTRTRSSTSPPQTSVQSKANERSFPGTGNAQRNEGERLLESYLVTVGLGDFEFERDWPGKKKKPDYTISFEGKPYLLEVKEFEPQPSHDGVVLAYDPYSPLRKRIEEARRKFREFKDDCCSLVLYSQSELWVDIESPDIMFAAMFGDLRLSLKVDAEKGKADTASATITYGKGGKMLCAGRPQNTAISAVLALRYVYAGRRRIRSYLSNHPKLRELKTDASYDLVVSVADQLLLASLEDAIVPPFDAEEKHLGVVVYENPFSQKPLPRELFRGAYDERYAINTDGKAARIYVGPELIELEKLDELL